MNDWTEILDRGKEINAVYMDYMKAFDKVPHKRLIYKVRRYNISEGVVRWIEDFLNNRRQRVKVNKDLSAWGKVTSGIPQGSVLGPLLFVIYINDITDYIESKILLFADDTKIYREIKTEEDKVILQKDLLALQKWSDL